MTLGTGSVAGTIRSVLWPPFWDVDAGAETSQESLISLG